MRIHRVTIMRVAAGAILGAVFGACLPSMPEGERGPQCWTAHASDESDCIIAASWCFEGIDFETAEGLEELERCSEVTERCLAAASDELEQCERRDGCIAERTACEEDCLRRIDGGLGCESTCELDFERCAPWYDVECERGCERAGQGCLDVAEHIYEAVDCEEDRLECVLDCY